MIYAYNCTTHSVTGYSTYYLMFGSNPRLPIDIILNRETGKAVTHETYISNWQKRMSDVFKIVAEKTKFRRSKARTGDTMAPFSLGDRD